MVAPYGNEAFYSSLANWVALGSALVNFPPVRDKRVKNDGLVEKNSQNIRECPLEFFFLLSRTMDKKDCLAKEIR